MRFSYQCLVGFFAMALFGCATNNPRLTDTTPALAVERVGCGSHPAMAKQTPTDEEAEMPYAWCRGYNEIPMDTKEPMTLDLSRAPEF